MGSRVYHSRVDLGLGGHVVIGVVLGSLHFTTQTQYQV